MLNSIFPFFLSLYHLFAFITILIPLVLPYQWYSHLIKVGDEGVIPQSVDNYGCMIVGSKRYLTGVQYKKVGYSHKTSVIRTSLTCLNWAFTSGGGPVGRAVASDTRDPRFKSQHRQSFIYQL